MSNPVNSFDVDFTDERVPQGSIVADPPVDADVAELIRLIPADMPPDVAHWAALRALGYAPVSDGAGLSS